MKIPYEQRFGNSFDEPDAHTKDWAGPGLAWMIVAGPRIIDDFSYEAQSWRAARNKHGRYMTFASVREARDWARKHPRRIAEL